MLFVRFHALLVPLFHRGSGRGNKDLSLRVLHHTLRDLPVPFIEGGLGDGRPGDRDAWGLMLLQGGSEAGVTGKERIGLEWDDGSVSSHTQTLHDLESDGQTLGTTAAVAVNILKNHQSPPNTSPLPLPPTPSPLLTLHTI